MQKEPVQNCLNGGPWEIVGAYEEVKTCKANNIDPYRYLKWLFQRIPFPQTADDYVTVPPMEHVDRSTVISQRGGRLNVTQRWTDGRLH